MAEAMNMTPDEFRKKLKKSTDHAAKKKKVDSAENKKEIKKLQKARYPETLKVDDNPIS